MRTWMKKRVVDVCPSGRNLLREGGVHFRVWAPSRTSVDVLLEDRIEFALEAEEENGYFCGTL